MNSKFSIEENWHDGDPLDEEIASYIVRDSNKRQILVVEAHVTFDEELDSLVVNRISIPVDPDVNGLDVPTKRMADILAALAKEGTSSNLVRLYIWICLENTISDLRSLIKSPAAIISEGMTQKSTAG